MPRAQEKRTDQRITTVIPVRCRIVGLGGPDLPSQRGQQQARAEFAAKTVNVSHSGMLINCDSDLRIGTRLDVNLEAPTDGHAIRILAEVAWSRRNAMNLFGHYAAGLKIKRITEKDRDLLKNFFK